ncbi:hypothetical protein BO86DRAFT_389153 [Aspergillus japonicus CBS 114.51]|uniref:Uncharacterized protein n=1 Tax=Aspergillus japonicus CBS 114.51 TaxID=1448312 RepID=A0A8T8X1S5_ASPJA|nr:hypothetical protein BO86DRAFT_389153 [Aspergillus japonicus CBS 114.51]RAH81860.1 hypothetical protein BO86DRAFT_389153 [Aspergillus japonicus CBS 114.51]
MQSVERKPQTISRLYFFGVSSCLPSLLAASDRAYYLSEQAMISPSLSPPSPAKCFPSWLYANPSPCAPDELVLYTTKATPAFASKYASLIVFSIASISYRADVMISSSDEQADLSIKQDSTSTPPQTGNQNQSPPPRQGAPPVNPYPRQG